METWNKFHMVAALYQTFYTQMISYDTIYKILIYIYTHTHTHTHTHEGGSNINRPQLSIFY